ncbi:ImpA family type VI secretion system protein [Burkholderia stagnalis]|uniref:type VI secretion system protein TssA n=1 Tax=Burkholderia stagnalis TaxID=1503054 RepID=UPI00075B06BD|nr:type VI secretion system ImpA family N-terminal domain-containing protein [Burkholderia stagnalis]
MSARHSQSARAPLPHDWMTPIEATAPCGPDLEYDPEFVVLASRIAVQPDSQYGNFVGTPEPVNWSDIDRDCRRLMMRSKDIRLAVTFTRCRTQLAGSPGLAEGLRLLASWLITYPDAIHPQLTVDTDRDAALEIRTNALQALTDAGGLLSDVREIVLTQSSIARLQMRDVERAFAHPRPSDALTPDSVTLQIDDLRVRQPRNMTGFDEALAALNDIDRWCGDQLGPHAPDLSVFVKLLNRVGRACTSAPAFDAHAGAVSADSARVAGNPDVGHAQTADADQDMPRCDPHDIDTVARTATASSDRRDALQRIREARAWFEVHEPSSPIPVLLKRAEQLVGKRYVEVVNAIPAELLLQWDADDPPSVERDPKG